MLKFTAPTIKTWSRLGPSGALSEAAMELAKTRDDVVFFSADMSRVAGLERVAKKYPDKHYNSGIAEQNMIGMAAGMSKEGYMPFAVTYATFFSCRSLDQIKVCLGYMNSNVKMLGIMGGFTSGILGATHMSLEDIAIMRAIPNMTVISPADGCEMVKAIMASAEIDGPVYIRLSGSKDMPVVYGEDFEYTVGKANLLREGSDVAIFANGALLHSCLEAVEKLSSRGVLCTLYDMHTVKPLDKEAVDRVRNAKLIVTVEEHNVIGGLGSAVAEYLCERKGSPALLKIGVEDYYPHAGSTDYLFKECGLDADTIAERIYTAFKEQ